jgi:hypothetical protein
MNILSNRHMLLTTVRAPQWECEGVLQHNLFGEETAFRGFQ